MSAYFTLYINAFPDLFDRVCSLVLYGIVFLRVYSEVFSFKEKKVVKHNLKRHKFLNLIFEMLCYFVIIVSMVTVIFVYTVFKTKMF